MRQNNGLHESVFKRRHGFIFFLLFSLKLFFKKKMVSVEQKRPLPPTPHGTITAMDSIENEATVYKLLDKKDVSYT
jgi:hypothetical protein